MTTPTLVPTTEPTTSSIHALPDFTSLFRFDQRVSALEQELSQVKQIDHSAQILSQIPKADYEYLDEITVRKEDQKLYKFVEGDFSRLSLRDIEDMLL
ncbi:hypothetical protein Tco_0354223, partial [Tanacetum coccineum]